MALTRLCFILEVFHHIHKDTLCLAIKALSLERVKGRLPSLESLFALEIAAELDDAISFTLKGKHVNYIIVCYYAYLQNVLCND